MKPLSRHSQNKRAGAAKFKHHGNHTKGANIAPPPLRGGYRL